MLTLQAGILRVTVREDEVLLLENEKPAVTVRTESRGTTLRQSAVSSELDIRGMKRSRPSRSWSGTSIPRCSRVWRA